MFVYKKNIGAIFYSCLWKIQAAIPVTLSYVNLLETLCHVPVFLVVERSQ